VVHVAPFPQGPPPTPLPPGSLVPFLKGWGSLIVATIALIQPWALALFRRLFRRGTIDIYPSLRMEIGYAGLGPTVGLTGTLRAVHKDHFVESIQLSVTKQKDDSHHEFDWILFRAGKFAIGVGGGSEVTAELISSFMLTTAQPYRYNVLFQDAATQGEMRRHIEHIQAEWTKARTAAGPETAADAVFDALVKQGTFTESYTALDRLMYWEAGKYTLVILVNTARPEQAIIDEWQFELTEDDIKTLRLNPFLVVRETCGLAVTYNFAYPDYEDVPEEETEAA
jgi:hypothetical protein